jgi:hypothetical protein
MYLQMSELEQERQLPRKGLWTLGNFGQPAVENKFSTCWDQQKNAIQAVFPAARRAVTRAAAVLGSAYGRPDGLTQATRDLLKKHFHTDRRDDIYQILIKINRIQRALDAGIKFECEVRCAGGATMTCGYAYATQWFGGRGPVHLCFDDRPGHCGFTQLGPQDQQALIIHEVAHRYVGIDDKIYAWEDGKKSSRDYRTLSPSQAMDNADSYAWFCVEL